MKSLIKTTLAAVLLLATVSCGNGAGNMTQMNQMKDSIFAAYPTVAAVTINVENDNELVIALGSEDLYGQDEVKRQAVANEMGAMALRIFGKESKLEHGKIMVTKNEMNQEAMPAGALVNQIDFVSLKRVQ